MPIFENLQTQRLLHACLIGEDGTLVDASPALLQRLGHREGSRPLPAVAQLFSPDSARRLRQQFIDPPADGRLPPLTLTLLDPLRGGEPVHACGVITHVADGRRQLQLALLPAAADYQPLAELQNANDIMSQMLASARVAYWCIEWLDPVEVTQPVDEVVRQVFENRSQWRMCNPAMREVYEMPADVVFSQQPVRLYWPRSPANEEFVRRLISTGFSVDGALSVDRRHDGSPAYVENDVRATIERGQLLRMWGSIRDVSQALRIQQDADRRIDALRQVFDAVPDAVVVVDERQQPQWRNVAFERMFGMALHAGLSALLDEPHLAERAWHQCELTDRQGMRLCWHLHRSRIERDEGVNWQVIVLRPAARLAQSGEELHP